MVLKNTKHNIYYNCMFSCNIFSLNDLINPIKYL